MPVIQKHKEGHPCWADLNSIDAELAAELGADIVLPRTSLGAQGYMAVLKDPTGAHFSLHMSKSSG